MAFSKKSFASALAAILIATGVASPTAWGSESATYGQEVLTSAAKLDNDAKFSHLLKDWGKQDSPSGRLVLAKEPQFYSPVSHFKVAPIIIWGGLAALGILAGGGLIFYAMYSSHEEKQTLINRCYDEGGTPVVDSRDSAGVEGTTDSGAAKHSGGYRFECQK